MTTNCNICGKEIKAGIVIMGAPVCSDCIKYVISEAKKYLTTLKEMIGNTTGE